VAERLGVSRPTARGALSELMARGVLSELDLRSTRQGRPARWYSADALLDLVRRWSG